MRLITAGFVIPILLSAAPLAAQSLIFNQPAPSEKSQEIINLLTEAYRRIGIKLELVDFQHGKSLDAANQGLLDGQLGRVGNLETRYPNLQRNSVPIANLKLILLTKQTTCVAECDVNSLKNLTYSSSYPFSSQYLEKINYRGVALDNSKLRVQLSLLDQAKVEGVITLDYLYREQQKSLDKLDFKHQILEKRAIYHYLHKKHQHLLPRLDHELKALCENRC